MAVTGSVVVTRETERDWQVCADGAKVEMGISREAHRSGAAADSNVFSNL